jgi:hypothetical protein
MVRTIKMKKGGFVRSGSKVSGVKASESTREIKDPAVFKKINGSWKLDMTEKARRGPRKSSSGRFMSGMKKSSS